MVEGVTYQSKRKFSAGLYALEVKSRFIDQTRADGFYKGFGEELAASATGNVITVGTGAFLVQGRMNVVNESERVVVSAAYAGKKGMLVAHINTFQPDTGEYCVLQTFFDSSVDAIEARLKRENTYAAEADTSNRVYELPLFTFDVGENGTVSNLLKVIKPIEDYAAVKALYDEILNEYRQHNDEMKKIKDEIVVRQGTIVTSGGQNLLTFDADTKADKADTPVLEFDRKPTENSLKLVNSGAIYDYNYRDLIYKPIVLDELTPTYIFEYGIPQLYLDGYYYLILEMESGERVDLGIRYLGFQSSYAAGVLKIPFSYFKSTNSSETLHHGVISYEQFSYPNEYSYGFALRDSNNNGISEKYKVYAFSMQRHRV